MSATPGNVAVVAIGRNEGQRLIACIESALKACPLVVYADSGSTDNSVRAAGELGAHVVQLDLSTPFTAARSRNAGFAELRRLNPAAQFVQFVDGDCTFDPEWMAKAIAFLTANPTAAVVCGRRRERFPRKTVYNHLCDMEWDTPVGTAKYCGGDAMMRVEAFEKVGGYNPAVIAGEEPELCVRLRAAGWTIHRIDGEMTLHDADMTRFAQWWKRNIRAGHAFAEGHAMHGQPPERHRARETRGNFVWGLLVPIIAIAATSVISLWRPSLAALGALPLLGYPLLLAKVARGRMSRGAGVSDALLYAWFVVLGKFPQAIGQLTYLWNRARGRRTVLIEYKGAAAESGGSRASSPAAGGNP